MCMCGWVGLALCLCVFNISYASNFFPFLTLFILTHPTHNTHTCTHPQDRVLYALFPFQKEASFIQLLGPNPDAYGPFWVATTLVFVIAVVSNLSSYFNFAGEEGTKW